MTKAAIRTIYENLKQCKLIGGAQVLQSDSFAFLERIASGRANQGKFDFIFVAPPQYLDLWKKALQMIDAEPDKFLLEYGQVVVQIDPKEYMELTLTKLKLYKQRTYGTTMLCFYERV